MMMNGKRTQSPSKPQISTEAIVGRIAFPGDSGVYIIGIGDDEPEAILPPHPSRERSPEDDSLIADVFAKAQQRSDQILQQLQSLESRLAQQSGIRTSV
jgi:hypothetical protein